MFNYNILGRSETTGFYSQQFINTDGAMKSRVNPEFSNNLNLDLNNKLLHHKIAKSFF